MPSTNLTIDRLQDSYWYPEFVASPTNCRWHQISNNFYALHPSDNQNLQKIDFGAVRVFEAFPFCTATLHHYVCMQNEGLDDVAARN